MRSENLEDRKLGFFFVKSQPPTTPLEVP